MNDMQAEELSSCNERHHACYSPTLNNVHQFTCNLPYRVQRHVWKLQIKPDESLIMTRPSEWMLHKRLFAV